jgi:hypothetical protein
MFGLIIIYYIGLDYTREGPAVSSLLVVFDRTSSAEHGLDILNELIPGIIHI